MIVARLRVVVVVNSLVFLFFSFLLRPRALSLSLQLCFVPPLLVFHSPPLCPHIGHISFVHSCTTTYQSIHHSPARLPLHKIIKHIQPYHPRQRVISKTPSVRRAVRSAGPSIANSAGTTPALPPLCTGVCLAPSCLRPRMRSNRPWLGLLSSGTGQRLPRW